MREELTIEIVNALSPYLSQEEIQEMKFKLVMILNKYEIQERCTEIAVLDEDKNTAILRRFIAAKMASGRTSETINYYHNSIETFFHRTNKSYDEITADDIRLYLAMRVHQDKVSKTTANNERRNLSAFYGWLQKEEILLKNPMSKIDVIKEIKRPKKAFDEMDIERMRESCQTAREKLLIELLLSTWCRVAEVAQIRLDEISDDAILVHGKGEKDRTVYLNAKCKLALEKYLAERKDSNPYLFPKPKNAENIGTVARGRDWYKRPNCVSDNGHIDKNSIEAQVKSIGKRAGVKNTHPHRFRRTGATYALRSGMPLMTVSKLLGHSGIGVTQVYLDISDAELEEAHKKYVK